MRIIYFERIGALVGIAAVLSDARNHSIARPLNIMATALSIVVYLYTGLYASVLLDLMYALLDFYGIYYALYRKQVAMPLHPTKASWTMLGSVAVAGVVSAWLLGFVLNRYSSAELAYWDSLNACFALIAYWMLMHRKLEGWILSGLFDAYYAGICYYEGLYSFFIEQVIISLLALYGYWSWRRAYLSGNTVPSIYSQQLDAMADSEGEKTV